jgi:Na+/H+ antiporter NhaC
MAVWRVLWLRCCPAFFGDNLSFISDTTIAATRTQGCGMRAKFRANILIVLPAALITLLIYIFGGNGLYTHPVTETSVQWVLMLPYLLIIVLALMGINVTIVLTTGIVVTYIIGLFYGMAPMDGVKLLGDGIDSMGNLIIITLMAAGMLGIVKALGGIDFVLRCLTRHVHGSRGAQACIAVLTAIVNLCTANNTVAIITVGPISREICHRYGVTPRKAASLLDTASCIIQCLIPYGAQTLLATALAGINPAAPWPYLFYPWVLALMVGISIVVRRK